MNEVGAERSVNKYIRYAAVLGSVGIVAADLFGSQPTGLPNAVLTLFAISLAAVIATLLILLPEASRKVVRHSDIIVPQLLFIAVDGALRYIPAGPRLSSLNAAIWEVRVTSFQMSISVLLLLRLIFSLVYAGWTTDLILQAVLRNETSLFQSIKHINTWFWKTLVSLAFGWSVIIALGISLGSEANLFTRIMVAALSLSWNLVTSALLLTVLSSRGHKWRQISKGLAVSWKIKREVLLPLTVQILILGWITISPAVIYSLLQDPSAALSHTQWQTNGFWVGGYEEYSRWYARVQEELSLQPSPLITTLLSIVLSILAITIKIKVLEILSLKGYVVNIARNETKVEA